MTLHTSIVALLAEIDAFRSRTGMTASAFGRTAVSDPNFIGDLHKGRMPSLLLIDRVRNFMQSQEESAA
jgi:hypothetical protein